MAAKYAATNEAGRSGLEQIIGLTLRDLVGIIQIP